MAATLNSPGVSVSITNELMYTSAGLGTVPFIAIATAANKASPSGTGAAPGTTAATAGQLFLATSQRNLIQQFGNPIFYSSDGTPLNGYELNEYGLHAAYQYLGLSNSAYILRADIDLAAMLPTTTAPTGPPVAGTYWLNTTATKWGVFRSNGNTTPGLAWVGAAVDVPQAASVTVGNVPLTTYGTTGDFAVVTETNSNLLYEKFSTVVTGTIATTTLTVTVPGSTPLVQGMTLTGSGLTAGTTITQQLTTTDANGAFGRNGTYQITPSQTVSSPTSITGTAWFKLGTTAWNQERPTVITSTTISAFPTNGSQITINGITTSFSSATTAALVASQINATAGMSTSGIVAANPSGSIVTITNYQLITNNTVLSGTALPLAGILAQTYPGPQVTFSNSPQWPAGSNTGDVWVKLSPANSGAAWSVNYYNGNTASWSSIPAPFYAFTSPDTDTSVLSAITSPSVGQLYIGYDQTAGAMQIRIWGGSSWSALVYEASLTAPTTAPVAGTLWFNAALEADVMVGTGQYWQGYQNAYPGTDPNGVIIDGSAPTTQSDTTALVTNDLWLDSSNLEGYPALYRYSATTALWTLIDNTDTTSPFGIIFADARHDSGPTYTGIGTLPGETSPTYTFNSTASSDLVQSDFVDPDAPFANSYPQGMLLFNTRASTNNVKEYQPLWFKSGGFSTTDYTTTSYPEPGFVNSSIFTFPPTSAARWVTASGNNTDGSPFMGRKAQRNMVVQALAAVITDNEDIRAETNFYNLIAAPGYVELLPDMNQLNTDIKQIAFVVGDTPARLTTTGNNIPNWATNAANVSTDGEDGLTTTGPYIGLYYPWGLSTNYDGSNVMVPPSTIALFTIAYSDSVSYVWYAPAGFNRGLVQNASSVGYLNSSGNYTPVTLNQGQRDSLYVNNINPIAYLPGKGLVVFGQKTTSPIADAEDRINVARLDNYVRYNIANLLQAFLFEPNTQHTRDTVQVTVQRFFVTLVGLQAIADFVVVCDTSNNTPETIDANELWVDIAYLPIKAIEFIYVPIRVVNGSVTLTPGTATNSSGTGTSSVNVGASVT